MNSRIQYLFEKYFEKTVNPEERKELADLISIEANREQVMQLFSAAWEKYQDDGIVISAEKTDEMLRHILGKGGVKDTPVPVRGMWLRWAAAASIILLAGTASYFLFLNRNDKKDLVISKPVKPDVLPGGNKAVLITADGKKIILDDPANTKLNDNGVVINNGNGQLAYDAKGISLDKEIYNTVQIPRKGFYRLVLSDGTAVWLNSESSLTYPLTFMGKERKVSITGEAYFEVAHDASRPFKVDITGKGEVEVLGTHFNINSYNDEAATKVTLLEGKVKISGKILAPGQQAELNTNGTISIDNNVDLAEITAWKDNRFYFMSADIKTIMRQLARWYDVDVAYEGEITNHFTGIISRNVNASGVFTMLEQTGGVHFEIDGKKIIVRK